MHELKYFSADVGCEWKAKPAFKPIYILLPACCTEQLTYNTDYQLGPKPTPVWRSTHDTNSK